MVFRTVVLIFISCSSLAAFAAGGSSGSTRNRLDGGISAGQSTFDSISPSTVKMGTGIFLSLQAEKPFGGEPFYLEAGVDYFHNAGTLNYSYLGTVQYTANGINYLMDIYDAHLGVRFKLFDHGPVRPYIEGGGSGGFTQLSYDNTLTSAVKLLGNDYKTVEGQLDFGTYAEAGIEFDFSSEFGIRASYRYNDSTTQAMSTLAKQQLHFIATTYYGSVYFHF
jgi:hypothetical protein